MARRTSPLTISVPFLWLLLELLIVFFCFVTLIVRPFIYKKLVAFVVIAIFPYGIEHLYLRKYSFFFCFSSFVYPIQCVMLKEFSVLLLEKKDPAKSKSDKKIVVH